MTNKWTLTEEVRQKFTPVICEFIDKLESTEEDRPLEIDLSGSELNPYTLCELLEGLGYKEVTRDDNGWQLDFWITFAKDGFKKLSVNGTAIIFELKLSEHL